MYEKNPKKGLTFSKSSMTVIRQNYYIFITFLHSFIVTIQISRQLTRGNAGRFACPVPWAQSSQVRTAEIEAADHRPLVRVWGEQPQRPPLPVYIWVNSEYPFMRLPVFPHKSP